MMKAIDEWARLAGTTPEKAQEHLDKIQEAHDTVMKILSDMSTEVPCGVFLYFLSTVEGSSRVYRMQLQESLGVNAAGVDKWLTNIEGRLMALIDKEKG